MNIFRDTLNIFKREEKKVEYLELIYDLIFVYMVGRDNSVLENIQNGFVSPQAFQIYIFCTLSIIQIWAFTSFYINMFGRNSLRDHIFMLLNMYLLYFLGEATRMDAVPYIVQYHTAWALILVNIAVQYLIELRNHETDVWNRDVIRRMSITLFAEAIIAFIAGFLPVFPSTILSYIAVLTGIVLTVLGRRTSAGGQVDFMHLTERVMLYVVFTFGEMVIAIASYFDGDGTFHPLNIYFSLFTFLVAVGMFLSYEIVYDYLVNREGEYDGLLYMMIHIFLIFAINNITVSFEFMREEEVALLPKIILLTISLVAYYLIIFLLGAHFRPQYRLKSKVIVKFAALSLIFIILMITFREEMAVNLLISVIYTFVVLTMFARHKLTCKNS